MSIQPDSWIKKMCKEHNMIEPFLDYQVSEGKISYGLSSMGYDVRISDEYRIFTNVNSSLVDPKNFSDDNFIERKGPYCICLLYTSPSPRDRQKSRMPSSA